MILALEGEPEADVAPENWDDWQADGWSVYGVASSDDLFYDDTTNYYSNTLDLNADDAE
ncbi:MAG: hypothetical protein MZV65_28975 [Chromatiales bacterium]|nr:hypothetical protein [Chromatiales bacterium]